VSTSAIAQSGLNVASLGLAVAANNVANLNSDGYKAKSLSQEETKEGGVQASQVTESQQPTVPDGSNVDLATEMTSLMTQSGAYTSNLKVMKTQDEMLGQLMDMRG